MRNCRLAAIGWLMLGDLAEARVEFEQVAAHYRRHPHKLHVEWRLLSEEKLWKEAVRIAELQIAVAPAMPAAISTAPRRCMN